MAIAGKLMWYSLLIFYSRKNKIWSKIYSQTLYSMFCALLCLDFDFVNKVFSPTNAVFIGVDHFLLFNLLKLSPGRNPFINPPIYLAPISTTWLISSFSPISKPSSSSSSKTFSWSFSCLKISYFLISYRLEFRFASWLFK